jgi:hypothetical protein
MRFQQPTPSHSLHSKLPTPSSGNRRVTTQEGYRTSTGIGIFRILQANVRNSQEEWWHSPRHQSQNIKQLHSMPHFKTESIQQVNSSRKTTVLPQWT